MGAGAGKRRIIEAPRRGSARRAVTNVFKNINLLIKLVFYIEPKLHPINQFPTIEDSHLGDPCN